jgi:hypothetical protein
MDIMELVTILIWCLFGWACYKQAQKKNRNETLWAVLGVLFGIFALAVILLLPPVNNDNGGNRY